MNAYLAEVVKKREEEAALSYARNCALRILKSGKYTLEEIAEITALTLSEVKTLADKS